MSGRSSHVIMKVTQYTVAQNPSSTGDGGSPPADNAMSIGSSSVPVKPKTLQRLHMINKVEKRQEKLFIFTKAASKAVCEVITRHRERPNERTMLSRRRPCKRLTCLARRSI